MNFVKLQSLQYIAEWAKTLAENQRNLKSLRVNASGRYVAAGSGRGDWNQRFGMSGPPLTLREPFPFTSLHKVHIYHFTFHLDLIHSKGRHTQGNAFSLFPSHEILDITKLLLL